MKSATARRRKAAIRDRLATNTGRVLVLIAIYENLLRGKGSGRRGWVMTDVLRSAVVLLHAALEDCMRSIADWKWAEIGADALVGVPLAPVDNPRKAEGFKLADLAQHKTKTVAELLSESVRQYLEFFTISNEVELAAQVKRLGLDPSKFANYYPGISEMMKRRHHIVHQADSNPKRGSGHHQFQSISATQVIEWNDAVGKFCLKLLSEL